MLGAIFSLFFLMIFMLAVMVTDLFNWIGQMRHEINDAFSKDQNIFPDHEYFL
jgi:hypothetical protein